MKTKSFIVASLLAVCGVVYAQTTMKITFKNAETEVVSYNVEDIQDITFEVAQPADERAVDLGLPSGTMWASVSLGQTEENPSGNYYSWGEVTPKTSGFDWRGYTLCDGSNNTLLRYVTDETYGEEVDGLTQLEPADDAAQQDPEWGAHWRIPTLEQYHELYQNCDRTYSTDENKIKWCTFTSKINGAEIKVAQAGYYDGAKLNMKTYVAYMWLRDIDSTYDWRAQEGIVPMSKMWEQKDGSGVGDRRFGQTIRPVYVP